MSKSVLFAALAPQPSARFGAARTPTQAEVSEAPARFRKPAGSSEGFTLVAEEARQISSSGWVVEETLLTEQEAAFLAKYRPDLGSHAAGDRVWFVRPYQDSDLKLGLGADARKAVAKYSPPVQVAGFQVLPGPATNDISGIDSKTLRDAVQTLRLRKQLDAYWTEQTALYRSIGVPPSEATQARLDRLAVLLAMTAQPAAFVETSTAFMDRYLPGFSSKGAANRARFGAPQLVATMVAFVVAIPVAYYLYAALIGLAAYTISYLKAVVEIQRLDLELTKKMADICNDPNATPEARAAACKYLENHKPPEPPPDLSDLLMWGGVAVVGLFGASIMLPVLADSARDSLRGRRD